LIGPDPITSVGADNPRQGRNPVQTQEDRVSPTPSISPKTISPIGLGANLPRDAVDPSAFVGDDGRRLNGANRHVLHFAKGQTPPRAFWSLTMYDAQSFFVDNIRRDPPGQEKGPNWLPAAQGDFSMTMRIDWPQESVIDGSWRPPAVQSVK
jgi:hypothetical protein